MFEVNSWFDIVWAVGASVFGLTILLFQNKFLTLNAEIYSWLYKKVDWSIFAHGEKKMKSKELKVVTSVVGVVLFVSGIGMLYSLL